MRWFIKPDVSSGTRQLRLWQHGTSLSFSQKDLRCDFFCEKDLVASA
jgi:hypothetical protein